MATVVVVCLYLIVDRASAGELQLEEAAVAALATSGLANQLQSLTNAYATVRSSALFVTNLDEFLREPPSPVVLLPRDLSGQVTEAVGSLELRDVVYAYPDQEARGVDGVNLTLRPGEIVAVVGENGSGKSTLAKILAGLYTPTAGRAVARLSNGEERVLAGLEPGTLAAVFQDFSRYELTLSQNVRLGAVAQSRDADTDAGIVDQVEAALRAVGLADAVAQLPQGSATRLGRQFASGSELSIGQWQRLAVARSVFSKAPFVILDEPTSALDPKVEAEIFNNLRGLYPGRGVLLISHRLSSVRDADHIVLLAEGRTAERGTHDELMVRDGLYAALFRAQAQRYLDP